MLATVVAIAAPAAAQLAAVQSGAWSNPATWGGRVPDASDAAIVVPAGLSLTIDADLTVGCTVDIFGTLALHRGRLVVDEDPAEAAAFVSQDPANPANCGWRWHAGSTAILDGGPGVRRHWGFVAAAGTAGSNTITIEGDISDWPVGAEVGIKAVDAIGQSERRHIIAVAGSTLTLDAPLVYNHLGPGASVDLLTRDLVFETVLAGSDAHNERTRGYAQVVFLPGTHIETVRNVEFYHMGHYGIDGAYPLHLHRLHDDAQGVVLDGLSFVETGFRCTNTHESNGVTVVDTVAYDVGGGACHFVQTDTPTTLADYGSIHNDVIGVGSVAFSDRGAVAGEFYRGASGYWPGVTTHEVYAGDAVGDARMGTNNVGEFTQNPTGFQWPESATSTAGTLPLLFLANTASVLKFGAHLWQNRNADQAPDLVGWTFAGNATGLLHGAYAFPARVYSSRFVGNATHYAALVVDAFAQDSRFEGGQVGIQIPGGFSAQPAPHHPMRFVRNAFLDLPAAIQQATRPPCVDPAGEWKALRTGCAPSFGLLAGNTYTNVARPMDFGHLDNANAFWLDWDRRQVLLRDDQLTPTGEFTPALVTPQSVFNADTHAVETPIASLPPTITWTTTSYRNRPWGPVVLTLAYDPPPTVALTVTHTPTGARLSATVSPDTTRVEFIVVTAPPLAVQIVPVTSAPFAADVDLTGRYAYLVARAYDGTVIDAGLTENSSGGTTGVPDPGYAQRAYSEVVALGPEDLLPPVVPPVVPPTPDEQIAALRAQVAQLQTDLAARTAERDTAVAQLAVLQQQIADLQAALTTAHALTVTAETERDAALASLTQIKAQVAALVSQIQALVAP